MARNATLGALLTDLRAELKISLSVAHNVQMRDIQVNRLQRTQELLWEDFGWPFLRVERYLRPLVAQRYYDPVGLLKIDGTTAGDIRLDRIEGIYLRDGTRWVELRKGIAQEHMNAYDSDTGQRSWPPRRWAVSESEQVELWPIPNMNGDMTNRENLLKVVGIRNLRPFNLESDRADLDDRLLVLMVAAELLDGEAGQKKSALAQRRLIKVKGNQAKIRRFRLFGNQEPEAMLRGPPTVYYRTTP